EHRGELRKGGAKPELRDVAAQCRFAQDVCEAVNAPSLYPIQCVPARPIPLPILRRRRRPDIRSSAAALAWWADHLEQRGCGVLAVQPAQGQSDTSGGRNVSGPDAIPAHGASLAPQWTAVPSQLPARQLAGLPILGQRAGAVSEEWRPIHPWLTR